MNPADLAFARIVQQVMAAALHATAAYNEAQGQLDLARVLDPDRLTSAEGLARSRQTVALLSDLTEQHKTMFARFIAGASAQLGAAANEMAEDRRAAFAQSLLETINANLALQAQFYQGREQWIAAASAVLDLAEGHAGELWLEDGQLVVASGELLDRMRTHVEEIERVHRDEVTLLQERQDRIAAALACMNGPR